MMYPGRIVTYYAETQTADIIISAERVFSNTDGLLQTVPRTMLQGVPVHTSSGGGWAITFDIQPGDTCLIALSAVGYDHWLHKDKDSGGTVAGQPAPQLQRSFDENDGFAIVGLNTIPRAVANLSTDGSQWRNADRTQHIHLKADGVIEAASTVSIEVTAPVIRMHGNLEVYGNCSVRDHVYTYGEVNAVADVVAGPISLLGHKHTETGGTTSAPI